MKTKIPLFIFVFFALPIFAQKTSNVLQANKIDSRIFNALSPDPNNQTLNVEEAAYNIVKPLFFRTISEESIQVDSIVVEDDYQGKYKIIYTYDGNGQLLTELEQHWNNSFWENAELISHTYNQTDNTLTELIQTWESGNWQNSYLITYTFDNNGNLVSYLTQIWENNDWVNFILYTWTIDSNGNRTNYQYQRWTNNSWENYWLFTNTYNSSNELLTSLFQNWENTAWVNSRLYTYTYDANGNMINYQQQKWENDAWVNTHFDSYTYDANGNRLEELKQLWENDAWENNWNITWSYDNNNMVLTQMYQNWDDNDWEKTTHYTYTYDLEMNRTSELFQTWDIDEWTNVRKQEYVYMQDHINALVYTWNETDWIESSENYWMSIIKKGVQVFTLSAISIDYYYSDITGLDEEPGIRTMPLNVFPNPFTTSTTIEYYLNSPQTVRITIYDSYGRAVDKITQQQQQGLQKVVWTPEGLNEGIYYFRIEAGAQVANGKAVLVR